MQGNIILSTIHSWLENFSINNVVMMLMMIFLIIGAVDRIGGNKKGYGEEFERGFLTIGPIALSIAAIIAVSPLLSALLLPVIRPAFDALGADPSIFPAMLLGADMGGYALAVSMAKTASIGAFSGLIVACSLGPTLTFTLPVAMSILHKEDQSFLAAGILAGLITVPLGCFCGGIAMSMTEYRIGVPTILINLVPITLFSLLIILFLWKFPAAVIKVFRIFGQCITILVTILTAIAIFQQSTGIMFPLLSTMSTPDTKTGMTGLDQGLLLSGQIGIILAGAFPMVKWLTKVLQKPFAELSRTLHINEASCTGILTSMANFIPMLGNFHTFDSKGKLLNMAFLVSGLCLFGDFLGFTAGVDKQMVVPVIIGKAIGAVTALFVADRLSPKLLKNLS